MTEQENIQRVQQLFADFGKGDLPSVLKALSADVDWQLVGPDQIPYGGPRRGPEQVARFFADLLASNELQAFDVTDFLAHGDTVVVLGHERGKAKATGRTYQSEWACVFTLRAGKIARFRELTDSYALARAFF